MGLAKLVTAVDEDDPEVHPLVGFQMEIRRTLAAIRYYEEKIAELREDEAFWGMTKEVEQNSGEFGGTDITHEAKPNVYINAWERERSHLTDLHKLWITAKLDERRLQLEASLIDSLDEIITGVIVGLGRNPRDPEVRDVVRRSMLQLQGAAPAAASE